MNSGEHKISILLPVYNAMPYLRECLDSIIQQTEQHWELIAVNDFSEDNSGEVLMEYAQKDPRVIAIKNKAKGIIPALQSAYSKSSGDLITRMDADDKMEPTKLQKLKVILLQNGTGYLATGNVKYISENQLGGGYLRYEKWLNELITANRNFEEIYRECVIPSPCWMVWREDLDNCGGFEPDTYPEDYDLCFRFYQQKLKTIGSDTVLHYWRDHEMRSSRNDPNYANQQYFSLKMPWFLELDRQEDRPLILWGAGKKGKLLAGMLVESKQIFRWVCNSPSKWGHQVLNVTFENIEVVKEEDNPQIIIAVGNPEDQEEIKQLLHQQNMKSGTDYFFFC
jgi:glycosyltransferase involved in cell wall biosynthesis